VLHDVSDGKSSPKKDNGKHARPYHVHHEFERLVTVDGRKADTSPHPKGHLIARSSAVGKKLRSTWAAGCALSSDTKASLSFRSDG
jgi:hypothetical protein